MSSKRDSQKREVGFRGIINQIERENKNNIIVGQATVVGLSCGTKWVLPGGQLTNSRNRAVEAAKEINRLMQLARA